MSGEKSVPRRRALGNQFALLNDAPGEISAVVQPASDLKTDNQTKDLKTVPVKEEPPAPKEKKVAGAKAKPPVAKTAGKKEDKSTATSKDDPFGYIDQKMMSYPLVPFDPPVLKPLGMTFRTALASNLSVRVSMEFVVNLDEHLALLGNVDQSKWIREAMLRQLSIEQAERKKQLGR